MVDRPTHQGSHELRPVSQLGILWITGGLFAIIILLELVSSADYVFSYLYIGPILLATLRLNSRFAFRLTLLASFLTLFNLWIPGSHIITPYTIANRIIAVAAIVVAGVLSHRNRYYEEAIAQQQTKLQLQEQLANFRENFVSTLTHDLKTPLLGAIETLDVFQQERFGRVTEAQQQVLATMMRSQQTSLQLVETVLDIYRNDAEGVKLTRSPVNLVELVEQVIYTLNDLASSYRVSIVLSTTAFITETCLVDGDYLQLHRVVSNLLINAIYHSRIDGRVDVILETWQDFESPQQVVKVLDEGLGIRPEELPQLFERFYQGCSDRQAKGSGLGLYLSRQIVEAHGGTIWAENRAPSGAVFGFRLPA
ncbi:MAG: HAMP domain-containing histidine kinase [Tildeniella torsiva UHER 1998/13D]|jgi:two-component system NarL family sensor kinase|nr:HAMP domain-containing histidine kinase [Tildeniella torsiva UHER 1998/13D]